jgi:hypothetical protein
MNQPYQPHLSKIKSMKSSILDFDLVYNFTISHINALKLTRSYGIGLDREDWNWKQP